MKGRHRLREDDIQRAIVNYVRTVAPDCVIFAVPNAARRNGARAHASNGVSGLMKGVSDLIMVAPRAIVFAEVKTDIGKVSPEQLAFGMKVRELGYHWAVWRSIDDVTETLNVLGVETREVTTMASLARKHVSAGRAA